MSLAGKRKDREPSAAPPEIWSAILERLDARSLARARLVCREWRALATPLVRAARARECFVEPVAILRGGRGPRSIALWKGMFATTHFDSSMRLWNSSGECVYVAHHQACDAFGWGDALVSVTFDDAIRLWKMSRYDGPTLRSGRRIALVVAESFSFATTLPLYVVIVKPWDDRLVVCYSGGVIEARNGKNSIVSRMIGHLGSVSDVAALGERLASASEDSTVRIWDKAGTCVSVLRFFGNETARRAAPRALRVLAWGDRLAVAYGEGIVRIWTDATEHFDIAASTGAYMYVWKGTLLTRKSASVAYAWDEFGGKSVRPLSVDGFSLATHGLLATRDPDVVRVWGVPE